MKKLLSVALLCCTVLTAKAQSPGTQLWRFWLVDDGGESSGAQMDASPALGGDDEVYFASYSRLWRLRWKSSCSDENFWFTNSARISHGTTGNPTIAPDRTVYVSEGVDSSIGDSGVRAFNRNLTYKWGSRFTTTGQVFGAPALGTDGTIYVACDDEGGAFGINPGGSQKWAKTWTIGSDTVLNDIDASFALAADWTLYALGEHDPGYFFSLAAWPTTPTFNWFSSIEGTSHFWCLQ